MYIIVAICFNKWFFIPCDNWKTLFLIKFYRYHTLRSLQPPYYKSFEGNPYFIFISTITVQLYYQNEKFQNQNKPPRGVLNKSVLKICSKFTGGHPCQSVISIKLQSNFSEIRLRHGCSIVNLMHIFRTSFPKNTSRRLLLQNQIPK